MYIDYFDKFYNMEPYLEIDEKDWEYIKETFDKQDVKEIIHEIMDDAGKQLSYRGIATKLNDAGYKTARGNMILDLFENL